MLFRSDVGRKLKQNQLAAQTKRDGALEDLRSYISLKERGSQTAEVLAGAEQVTEADLLQLSCLRCGCKEPNGQVTRTNSSPQEGRIHPTQTDGNQSRDG